MLFAAVCLFVAMPLFAEAPRINGAKVYGARPGTDFLFKVAASGSRPMTFSAEGLPKGLTLDKKTGIIRGTTPAEGSYVVKLTAKNAEGSYERELRIESGERIALTPPMGWNSWNCWGNTVSQEKVMSSARALLEKGLDQYGWTYINIDDGWQGLREGENKALAPNSKFPDMKALADFLHSNGLKLGIYSSPWVGTYAGHIGEGCDNPDGNYWWIEQGMVDEFHKLDRSKLDRKKLWYYGLYSFVDVDAKQWAEWGIDYLKYDWSPNDEHSLRAMGEALRACGRDIVYSISNHAPVSLGPSLCKYAQCWRTTGDIRDNWDSMSKIGFEGQDMWAGYRSPGNWPDADMLVLGKVGWGPKTHDSKLTRDEQITHMTLWAILASPLLIGCDLAELDDFTLSLLCNPEVIDVNQDPLGYPASRIMFEQGRSAVYMKPLEDGSVALAMFNLSGEEIDLSFSPRELRMTGDQMIRDLWEREDISKVGYRARWSRKIPAHGAFFVKVTPVVKGAQLLGDMQSK